VELCEMRRHVWGIKVSEYRSLRLNSDYAANCITNHLRLALFGRRKQLLELSRERRLNSQQPFINC
jgi:hypothetical protein